MAVVPDSKERHEKSELLDTLDGILNVPEASDCFRTFLELQRQQNQFIYLECLRSLEIKYGNELVIGRGKLKPEDAPLISELMTIFYKYIFSQDETQLNLNSACNTLGEMFAEQMTGDIKTTTESSSLAIEIYEQRVKQYHNKTKIVYDRIISLGGTHAESIKTKNIFGIVKDKIISQLNIEGFSAFKSSEDYKKLKSNSNHHAQRTAKPPNIATELDTARCCVRECLEAINQQQAGEKAFFKSLRKRWEKWKLRSKKVDIKEKAKADGGKMQVDIKEKAQPDIKEKMQALYTLITSSEPFNVHTFVAHLTEMHSFLLSPHKTKMYLHLCETDKITPVLSAITSVCSKIPISLQLPDKASGDQSIRTRQVAVPTPTATPTPPASHSSTPSASTTPSSTPPASTSTIVRPASSTAQPRRSSLIFTPSPRHPNRSSRTLDDSVVIQTFLKNLDPPAEERGSLIETEDQEDDAPAESSATDPAGSQSLSSAVHIRVISR